MSQQLEILTENQSQWNAVSFVAPEIQKREIKPFVLFALKELEDVPDSRTSSLVNVERFSAVRAVVRHMARARSAVKTPWAEEDVRLFLEGLRFTPECVSELAPLLCTDRIYQSLPKELRLKPGLASLSWRIDASLSQSAIAAERHRATDQRVRGIMYRDTHIFLRLQFTDGRTRSYRLSVDQFHSLRFAVASALKATIVLEKRKCMRRD